MKTKSNTNLNNISVNTQMKSLNHIYTNLKLGSNAKVKDQVAK